MNNKLTNSDEARLNNTKTILEEINEDEDEPQVKTNLKTKSKTVKDLPPVAKRETRSITGTIPTYEPLPKTPKFLQERMEKVSNPEKIKDKPKEETYIIDKLIRKKNKKGKLFYKVLWEGYPEDEATWEPKNELIKDGNIELINQYDHKR